MATNNYMSGLFGRSPIKPLQEHMYRVYRTIKHLSPLVEGMIANDSDALLAAQKQIIEGEHDADEMKHELRTHLPKGLFMPVDRRDILDVLLTQDKIVNQAKDVAGMIVSRKMQLPVEMNDDFLLLTNRCIDVVKQSLNTINELDELVETGFRGLEVDRVETMIEKLGVIETETDKMQDKLRSTLFELEGDLDRNLSPVDIVFTYRLIEWVGNIADNAERVGSRLSLMLAR